MKQVNIQKTFLSRFITFILILQYKKVRINTKVEIYNLCGTPTKMKINLPRVTILRLHY